MEQTVKGPSEIRVFAKGVLSSSKTVNWILAALIIIAFGVLIPSAYLVSSLPDITYISSPEDLEKIRDNPSGYFQLDSSYIALPDDWEPIGTKEKPFTGTIDGSGYTIALNYGNLKLASSQDGPYYSGFIGYNAGTLENINFWVNGSNLDMGDSNTSEKIVVIGTLAAFNKGTIDNVYVESAGGTVKGNINAKELTFGLLAGYSSGTVSFSRTNRSLGPLRLENCEDVSIGLIGKSKNAGINTCQANFPLTIEGLNFSETASIGGIVGDAEQTIFTNCLTNELQLKGSEPGALVIGGIAGSSSNSSFSYCYSKSNTKVATILSGGGISGSSNSSTFSDCIVINPPANIKTVGQIVGPNHQNITFGKHLYFTNELSACSTEGSEYRSSDDIDIIELGWDDSIWNQEGSTIYLEAF